MKKILLIINLFLWFGWSVFAQLDSDRTNKTKIADALAVMPAKDTILYTQAMQDLVSTGEAGLRDLIKMREESNGDVRVKFDYALNSLANFVSGLDNTDYTFTLQKVLMHAIEESSSFESAAFYMKQLRTVGNNHCVSFLKSYLNDPKLSSFAARTLSGIGTGDANKILQNALPEVDADLKKYIVNALGEIGATSSEDLLLEQIPIMPEKDRSVIFFALGRCGTMKSEDILKKAVEQAQYTLDKNGATESYILLLKRMAVQQDEKDATKSTIKLLKNAKNAGETATRTAALEILCQADKDKSKKLIENALKDKNRDYRNAALIFAESYLDPSINSTILKSMKKANADIQSDIITWSGRNQIEEALPMVIEKMEDTNICISSSAIDAVARIGGKEAVDALCELIATGSPEQIVQVQKALTYTAGNITSPLMSRFEKASREGKIAMLQLVSQRKDDTYADQFLALCKDKDSQIRDAAFTNLAGVVTPNDLTPLFHLLETVPQKQLEPIQKAIITALSALPTSDRFVRVKSQMDKSSLKNKPYYFTLLAATNNKAALPILKTGFQVNDTLAKQQVVIALDLWNGIEAVDLLYDICMDRNSSSYFDKALDAYISKVTLPSLKDEKKLLFLRKALEIAQKEEQKKRILNEIQKTNTFLGLIIAGQYLDDPALQQNACQVVMQIALNNKQYAGSIVNELLHKVISVIDNPDSDYQKNAITKYLNETAGNSGFIPLFNGKDLSGWKGLVGNPLSRAKMTDQQLVKAQLAADEAAKQSWIVENGKLVFTGKGDNLCTTRPYGDFELYVDWLLYPEGPEADAGIYLRGTPQVQIWDTARVNVGAQVGSGGLYNNQRNVSKPGFVADNKLGEWNSFYIRMIGERVTVYLNGDKVVDNVIMENYWDRSQPIPMLEQIELQAHGSKVAYRDIYLREIPRVEPFVLSPEEEKEGFKVLFDGVSMFNWTGNTKDYVVEDGCIKLIPQNGGGGNLYTKDEYGDFIYRFEFQLTSGANNGLGIRTPMEGDAAYVGMELQILDNEDPIYSTLEHYQYHGSVYGVIPAKRGFLKETGEWNTQEVVAKGNRIKVTLNGNVILDGDIREASKNGTLDKREHPGLFNKKGHIAFLGHGSVVQFRNIRIKELK